MHEEGICLWVGCLRGVGEGEFVISCDYPGCAVHLVLDLVYL
jgi:hypothetical protein